MASRPFQEECYEDYFGDAMSVEGFPYVGTWIRSHFLVQLLSQTGEHILWTLGERVTEWLCLRATSARMRYALVFAVVEVLRRGPQVLRYSGPQWLEATEEFILAKSAQGNL